jgi:5-methylcytosine-specific restriction endonuclease McrA
MQIRNSKCLVLNADYSPLSIIDWKRAIVWSVTHEHNPQLGVEIIDFYKDDFICGVNNKKIPIPAVVKTAKYFRLHNQKVNFSRKNLFIRDDFTCQYCGDKYHIKMLTYDHVIPKSAWNYEKGSPTNWQNIVTACISCNHKKGNKTPKQANMPLKNLPTIPNKGPKYLPISSFLVRIRSDIPQEWKLFLPDSYPFYSTYYAS